MGEAAIGTETRIRQQCELIRMLYMGCLYIDEPPVILGLLLSRSTDGETEAQRNWSCLLTITQLRRGELGFEPRPSTFQ